MHDNQTEAGRLVDMDRHIQQTNDRLQCIKQQLQSGPSFQNAARELLEWCSDTRAFQVQFEEGLMGCLTVVSKTSSQPGYDLELGYRLLAVCASHKDLLSSKSAGLLSTWCEDLGRALLLRHQKTRAGSEPSKSPPPSVSMHAHMQKGMPPVHPGGEGGWGGPNPGQPGHQQLSVVTTIWGMTPATHSGPYSQNPAAYPNTSMTGAGPQSAAYPGGAMAKAGAAGAYNPGGMVYRRDSMNRYAAADRNAGMMTPAPGMSPNHPMGFMSSGVPPHMAGMRQVTTHVNLNPHGGGAGGGIGVQGSARMPLPPCQTMPPSNPRPAVSSPLNVMTQAPQMNPSLQGQSGVSALIHNQNSHSSGQHNSGQSQSPMNGTLPVQSPLNPALQSQSPHNASMAGQSPLNAAMQGQAQAPSAVLKPSMHPSPLHGDPGSSGYPPTPNTPGSNPPCTSANDFPPSGAKYAAAIAAATATATATAVVLDAQQNMHANMNYPQNPQMQMPPGQSPYGGPPQYSSGMGPAPRHAGPMGMTGPMGGKGAMGHVGPMPSMSMSRRPTPYPFPMMQKRPMSYPPNGTQMDFGPGGHVPMGGYPNHPYGQKGPFPPTQQPLPSPTGYMPSQGMRQMGMNPSHYPNGQPYMMPGQYPPARPASQPPFGQYPNQSNFQHSPLHGNPTPPMTPQGYPDIKPRLMKPDDGELRLTFPVRDGVVLPPFRLEHNLAVSNHEFHLRDSVYQTLVWRSDLELQLKCFHHEDRMMNTNWPASVTVSVNARPLDIERGENKSSHKPLHLKDVCVSGRNTIQITVTACCCSHLFVLQLVHRPSIRSVLQGLLRKRLLPAPHCVAKIKRNFSNVTTGSTLNGEDGVEQTAIKVPLKCPITCSRITLPARGHDCKHIQCFDLDSYLKLNCERGTWRCPVCNKAAVLEGLEIDQYIWAILTMLQSTGFEEVTIDQGASWKPVVVKSLKEEDNDSCAMYNKPTSPSSTQLPNVNSWIMGGPPSGFPAMPAQSQSQTGPGEVLTGLPLQGDHSQGNMAATGRPPSLSGPVTPSTQQGGPGTPQQQNGSHPLSHPPPSSSSGPTKSTTEGSAGTTDCNSFPDINFDSGLLNGDNSSNPLDLLTHVLTDQDLTDYLSSVEQAGSNDGVSDVPNLLDIFPVE